MDSRKVLESLALDEKIRLLGGCGDWHTYDCHGKVPAIMMTDGPHGLRKLEEEKVGDIEASKPATCFPTASALAASWNPKLVYDMGQAIAREAKKEQISIVLGCGINIKRSPLCGRNFEYFSEDPYITGKLATAYIQGVQSQNIGTSLKHFAANSQETRRMTSNSQVDERALREIYLSAFEEVIKNAKPTTVMASYNRVNGVYACKNRYLLVDILRKEWGYQGAVVSDWGACNDVVACLKNGMTLEMPDSQGYHTQQIKKAYEKGQIEEQEIDFWAKQVLEHFSSLSEYLISDYVVDMQAQHNLARQIENECAVLLKNEGLLPIAKDQKLIVIGEMAERMRFQGGGSSHIQATKTISAIRALQKAGYDICYVKGYQETEDVPDIKLEQEALSVLADRYEPQNTKILYFLGLTDAYEGEGYDRTSLAIPNNQLTLLKKIAKKIGKENIALISFGGAPMDFAFDRYGNALLHMYLGGQAVGESAADLISGKANPSGKLAETIPLRIEDTPAWRYFAPPHDDVEYRESIFVGYRYYETFGVKVKYPFGYGLSYTDFSYTDLHIPSTYSQGTMELGCRIKNVGATAGAETVQIYILPPRGKIMRSRIELKGFQKVMLEAGQEKELTFSLDERSFSIYDVDRQKFVVVAGEYEIAIGSSVRDIRLKTKIKVEGERKFRDERERFPDYFRSQPHGMEIAEGQFEELLGRPLAKDRYKKRGQYTWQDSFSDVTAQSWFGRRIRGFVGLALKCMFRGKREDDPAMQMVKKGLYEGNLEGLIATTGGIVSPKMIGMLVHCANREYKQAVLCFFSKKGV